MSQKTTGYLLPGFGRGMIIRKFPDEGKVPSLANLSLQAIFRGYGTRSLWGPLKALVDIQRKWLRLRYEAWMQAAQTITDFVQGHIQGYRPILTPADVEHVRRYRRLGLALGTSQARVHTLAITQSV
jgi:hypothetical protein